MRLWQLIVVAALALRLSIWVFLLTIRFSSGFPRIK